MEIRFNHVQISHVQPVLAITQYLCQKVASKQIHPVPRSISNISLRSDDPTNLQIEIFMICINLWSCKFNDRCREINFKVFFSI